MVRVCSLLPDRVLINGDGKFVCECILLLYKLGHYLNHTLQIFSSYSADELQMINSDILSCINLSREAESEFPHITLSQDTFLPQDKTVINGSNFITCGKSDNTENVDGDGLLYFKEESLLTADDDWGFYVQCAELLSSTDNKTISPFFSMSEIMQEQNLFSIAHFFIFLAETGHLTVRTADDSNCPGSIWKKWSEESFCRSISSAILPESVSDFIHDADTKMQVSRAEHNRWWAVQIANGWKYGTEKNLSLQHHPDMLPFDSLPNNVQKIDFDIVEKKIAIFKKFVLSEDTP